MQPAEIVRWMLLHPEDEPTIIVVVIDDSDDDDMASVFATEDILHRLGGALIFEVEDRSPHVAEILAERDDD